MALYQNSGGRGMGISFMEGFVDGGDEVGQGVDGGQGLHVDRIL